MNMVNLNNLIQFPFKINVIIDTNNITKLSYNKKNLLYYN
jgi:hypothetical protein